MRLCVSVATADGNIRALPLLSEIPPSFFPSLFCPAVSGLSTLSVLLTVSQPLCTALSLLVSPPVIIGV